MENILIEVQGQNAVAATEELLAISGVTGSYEVEEGVEKEGTLATIVSIVGIVGTAITIAEQIRKWYQEYKQGKSGKTIEKVLIVGKDGKRLLLENATLDDIRKILES